MLQTADWVKAYAERRGQAVTLVDSLLAAGLIQLAGATKRIRCRDGHQVKIAILHDAKPARVEAA